jgi:hypothetical protein
MKCFGIGSVETAKRTGRLLMLRVSLPGLGTGVTTFHAQQLAKVDLDVMIARGKV